MLSLALYTASPLAKRISCGVTCVTGEPYAFVISAPQALGLATPTSGSTPTSSSSVHPASTASLANGPARNAAITPCTRGQSPGRKPAHRSRDPSRRRRSLASARPDRMAAACLPVSQAQIAALLPAWELRPRPGPECHVPSTRLLLLLPQRLASHCQRSRFRRWSSRLG